MTQSRPESQPWWNTLGLHELTHEQWEALCDGCGRCCLHKFQEEDGRILMTDVACKLLDVGTCRCTNYEERSIHVPECLDLRVLTRGNFGWLPDTCAYRLRAASRPLPRWHPLVSGDPTTVVRAGISIMTFAIPEAEVSPDDLEDHIIEDSDES